MMTFELPPSRPTDEEFDRILADVHRLCPNEQDHLTEAALRVVVYRHVTFQGRYKRAGLDLSDAKLRLELILAQARKSQHPEQAKQPKQPEQPERPEGPEGAERHE